jgi:hypothetical protein
MGAALSAMLRRKRTAMAVAEELKQHLHGLVDALPEAELHAARRFLEYLRQKGDPVLRAFIEAPIDDEPLTEEDIAAIQEAEEELSRGKGNPWEQVRAE